MMQSITPRKAVSRLWLVCHFMPALSNAWISAHARRRRNGSGLLSTGNTCCTKNASSMFCTFSWCTIVWHIVIHMRSAPSNCLAVHWAGYAFRTCVMNVSVGSNMDLVRRVTVTFRSMLAALDGVPSSSKGSEPRRTKSMGSSSHSSSSSSEKHRCGYTSVSMICCMCGRSSCHMDLGRMHSEKKVRR